MNRPLLRARLTRRISQALDGRFGDSMRQDATLWHQYVDKTQAHVGECEVVLGESTIADRVLDRLSAEHGSGGLLDLLLAIDWVKLLEVVLAVVALFKSDEGDEPKLSLKPLEWDWSEERYRGRKAAREFLESANGPLDGEERPIDRKADKEEAEAKRERLADIDGETA